MELEPWQTDDKKPTEILQSLSPDQWKQLANELKSDSDYRPDTPIENLSIMLQKLEIHADAKALAVELFKRCEPTANKVYALSTHQLSWFSELVG